jgi:heptaprenyl diphosphate synthase
MDLKEIKDTTEDKLNKSLWHPYLSEKINIPTYNSELIEILISMLNEKGFDKETTSNYIEAIMLTYISLKTHDKIENSHLSLEEKQLTILAGAYYTGLYYLKLSKLQDVELIENLSNAIQEQNEIKATMNNKKYKNIDEILDDIINVEWTVFKHVINSMNLSSNVDVDKIKLKLLKIRLQEEVMLLNMDIITFINKQFINFYEKNKITINDSLKTWINSSILIK